MQIRHWCKRSLRLAAGAACLALAITPGSLRADEANPDLLKIIEEQNRVIQEMKQRLDALETAAQPVKLDEEGEQAGKAAAPAGDDAAVRKIIGDYLREHPGAGVPPSVQTGYFGGQGFVIRSAPSPSYPAWADESRIPFELRIRGRLQLPYYFYKVADNENHQTGRPANGQNLVGGPVNPLNPNGVATGNSANDFSQLEVKRMRLIFEGNAISPNLFYHVQLDGSTRGLGGLAGGVGAVGGGAGNSTVDHAIRLFSAFVAYDWRPCCFWKGCGEDCPEGTVKYAPTVRFIFGKATPLFGLEQFLGSGNEQFVEFSMANWYFDAEDDNLQLIAGTQIRALQDRLFMVALATNGNETQIANLQMDRLPGANAGFWYDFGGSWNENAKRWDLYGDHIADIDYSCRPVLRVGGAINYAPMNRRTQYSVAELNRVRAMPAAPGGSSVIGLLNGGGFSTLPFGAGSISQFAADAFDSTSVNAFMGFKYKGLSVYSDFWVRNLDHFRGIRQPNTFTSNPILYTSVDQATGANVTALFPQHKDLIDFGQTIQGGYFIIPKKLELIARWSWIHGESGSINGTGNFAGNVSTVTLPVAGAVRVIPGAFDTYATANEYTVGVNWYWKRNFLKWQNDVSVYDGGNPAAGGQSPAGYIPGVDGWLLRSQIQLFF